MGEHDLAGLMSTAGYIVRSFNRQSRVESVADERLAASEVCRITGSVAELAQAMPQALTYLAGVLQRAPAVVGGDEYALHPAHRCAIAAGALSEAADAFAVAAEHLCDAQAAVTDHDVSKEEVVVGHGAHR